MSLALFDLDSTLLGGDSDYEWGCYLAANGVIDGEQYARQNQRFFDDYRAGKLDIDAFISFSLRPLATSSPADLHRWRDDFIRTRIEPIMLPAAHDLVAKHRAAGDTTVIITATNRFITDPIAKAFGVDDLLATELEQVDGRFTGRGEGVPCFREGKIERLNAWLEKTGHDLRDSWCYSDSINDLPLLEAVTHPVAVHADEKLARIATERGWPQISLR